MLWDGGSKSWEPMEELKKDVPDDDDSLQRSEEASVGSGETEHVPEKPMMTSFKCDLDHGIYQLGVVYKQEQMISIARWDATCLKLNAVLAGNNLWKLSVLRIMILLPAGPVKKLHCCK